MIGFLDAVHLLQDDGCIIEWSEVCTASAGRFYKLTDEDSDVPPMWLSTRALCALAEALIRKRGSNSEGSEATA